jgi:hypothetical protein
MPNAIKYNVSAETLALKKGNFYIGTGDVGKGPTSNTGFYNGITPPTGGYTIYLNKASGGPSIYTVTTEAQLTGLTSTIAGQTLTTSGACLNYFATQTDKMIFNIDYPAIVTDGLVLNMDAAFVPSYPISGTSWYDVSSGGNNGSLINGPTYSSTNGGAIVFDGIDDYITIPDSLAPTPAVTMIFWINKSFTNYYLSIHSRNNNAVNGSHTGIGYGTPISSDGWIQIGYMGDGTNNYFIINGTIYSGNGGSQFPYDSVNSIVMFSMNNNGYFAGNNAPVTSLALTTSLGGYSGYQWLNRNYKTLGILSTSANRSPFNGQMSNSLFYNRILSATEITQNYAAMGSRYFSLQVQYLVVAGGGGGNNNRSGGGGAGGLLSGTTTSLSLNTNYTVTVGSGGAYNAQGSNSVFNTLTSIGGGQSGTLHGNGFSGGSGGGSGHMWFPDTPRIGGSGVSGQGFSGGSAYYISGGANTQYGPGGGGAGQVGADTYTNVNVGGAGGNGLYSSEYVSLGGSPAGWFAGGGGGGISYNGSLIALGGNGGGGRNTVNGVVNTGGGGGGNGVGSGGSASGGSGIVIIRVPVYYSATFSSGVTYSLTKSNGYSYYVVTATSTTSETVRFS